MRDAFRLLGTASVGMLLIYACLGYQTAYSISYGAFTIMAAMVCLTFLWLWMQRTTPLAMGMAFGWGGAATVMGWWWVYNLLDAPEAMNESFLLFLCLAVYFVGAILHFSVIGRSLGVSRGYWGLPVGVAVALSAAVQLLKV